MSGEPTENDLVLRLAESEVGGSASLSSDRTVSVLRAELETLTETLRRPRVENPYLHEAELAQAIRHVDALQDPAVTEFVSSSSPATPPNVEPNEESIGQYRLLGRLGAGGMGTVYRAFHVKLHRTVALKVLSNNPFRSPDVVARFEREMRAIGMLHHPNVVSAVDAGDVNGLHFLVMELVNGLNLSELQQRRGPLPVAEACELIRQAAVGLQYVHSRGLVHRDIKPSNLMLARPSDGHDRPIVKILDLGLALLAPSEERATHELTATGQLMGTIDYMAPEQASDTHLVDIRADIYSLGATLYKLLTGRAPVENDQNNSIMMRLRALGEETPPLVRTFRKDCPPELDALLQRLLSKTPADRPATPQHVAEALAPFARGAELRRLLEENPSPHAVPTNPPPTSRVTASPQRASRRRLWPLAWTAAFFIAAAGLWIGLNYRAVMLLVTGRGELTIEIDDPDIEVIVTQDDAVIHEKTKERRFRVRPVDGQVEFLDPETGAAALSKKFELRRAGDRVSVTVTSQDLERKGADVIQKAGSTPRRPPQPVRPLRPDRPQPFVLLRDNRMVGEFAFIPTNLPEFRDGDVIEVRGNGPFRLPQIKFTDRGLDLRAGEGYQPVFVPADVLPADQAWIIVAKGKLRLKGCEFRRMTYDDAHLIEAAGDSCEIVNCTLARGDSHARVLLDVNSSTVRIEDSLLIVGRGHASLSVGQDVREFTLRNSLFFTSSFDFLACQGGQDAQTVVLENNTFCGNGGVIQHFGSYLLMRDERFEGPPLKVIARRNVFASVCYFNTVFYLKDKVSPEEFRSVIAWEGEGNITPELRFPEATAKLIGPDKLGVAVDPNLRFYLHKAWSMDLPLAERLESIRDAVAGDLPAEGEPIGPDWNLIGPGAGYLATLDPAERDRHAEETHEGGPFTLLHEGAPAHGFITLADAVRAAQDGDVIELRSDDALTAQLDSSVPGKNLTLRAAAGYQPKYVDTTGFRPGPGHAWEIVNLTLHGAFAASGVRRLRNCAFDGAVHPSTHYAPGPLLFATEPDGPDVEVVNCCLPGTVMTESVSERKVVFRNCVLERCVVGDPVNQTNRDGQTIVLERCALWAPSGVTWLIATGNGVGPDGHANVVAERCILDGPLLAIRERRQLRWSGDWNLFRLWSRSWCWETANEYSEVGLSSWRKLWDSDAHSLSSVSIHFDPQQWRILPVDGAELPAAGVDFRLFHRPAAFH